MRPSAVRWLVLACAALFGCGPEAKIDLPDQATEDPATDDTGANRRVAVCDQAKDGTSCGLEKHCIFNACVDNACGDGIPAAREACDDGNDRDHDGCDARCRLEVEPGCGNGIVEPGEECDDETASLTCTAACSVPVCGDAIISPPEECDDGNTSDRDRCDTRCKSVEIVLVDGGEAPGDTGSMDAGTGGMEFDGAVTSLDAGTLTAPDAGPRPPFGIAQAKPACEQCRNEQCRTYQGLDFDFVAACFANSDPQFVQECVDVMDCAYVHRCGYSAQGLAQCFCGTADEAACQTPGIANGPCQNEIYAAADTKALAEVISRFGDLSLAVGVANSLQACDQEVCAACRP